jgi:hypothetical protein
MFRWIITITISAGTLLAQPSVSILPVHSSLAGLVLVGPNDPSFLPAIQALVGPSELPSYQPILPYSVFVRNNTQQPVIGVCVNFQMTQANGTHDAMVQSFEEIPPVSRQPVLPPGAQLFVSIERGYSLISQHSNLHSGMVHPLGLYSSQHAITISLDSAVFADGTFVGPDTQNRFAQYTAKIAADLYIAKSILAFQSSDTAGLQIFLNNEAALDRASGLGSWQTYNFQYTKELAVRARSFRQTLAKKGAADVASDATTLQRNASGISIHK